MVKMLMVGGEFLEITDVGSYNTPKLSYGLMIGSIYTRIPRILLGQLQ